MGHADLVDVVRQDVETGDRVRTPDHRGPPATSSRNQSTIRSHPTRAASPWSSTPCSNACGSRPVRAKYAGPAAVTQAPTSSPSTSGWNCTAAFAAQSPGLRADLRPGEFDGVGRQTDHVRVPREPRARTDGGLVALDRDPADLAPWRLLDAAPSAAASAWHPKQIPSTGTRRRPLGAARRSRGGSTSRSSRGRRPSGPNRAGPGGRSRSGPGTAPGTPVPSRRAPARRRGRSPAAPGGDRRGPPVRPLRAG